MFSPSTLITDVIIIDVAARQQLKKRIAKGNDKTTGTSTAADIYKKQKEQATTNGTCSGSLMITTINFMTDNSNNTTLTIMTITTVTITVSITVMTITTITTLGQ